MYQLLTFHCKINLNHLMPREKDNYRYKIFRINRILWLRKYNLPTYLLYSVIKSKYIVVTYLSIYDILRNSYAGKFFIFFCL